MSPSSARARLNLSLQRAQLCHVGDLCILVRLGLLMKTRGQLLPDSEDYYRYGLKESHDEGIREPPAEARLRSVSPAT